MAYFTETDKILCPYCGHEIDKDALDYSGEEVLTFECYECGYDFTISISISYSYTTQCSNKNGKDTDCDWKIYKYDGKEHYTADKKKVYAECSRCKEVEYVEIDNDRTKTHNCTR